MGVLGAVYGTRAIMCVFGVFKNRAVGRGVYSFLRCEPFSLQRCVCVCLWRGEGEALALWIGVPVSLSRSKGIFAGVAFPSAGLWVRV